MRENYGSTYPIEVETGRLIAEFEVSSDVAN